MGPRACSAYQLFQKPGHSTGFIQTGTQVKFITAVKGQLTPEQQVPPPLAALPGPAHTQSRAQPGPRSSGLLCGVCTHTLTLFFTDIHVNQMPESSFGGLSLAGKRKLPPAQGVHSDAGGGGHTQGPGLRLWDKPRQNKARHQGL